MAAADPACADLPPLIQGLLHPEAYPHPVGRIRLLQTHISWILLTGATAYKIKKPVDFGFVNFTSLGLRRHFCHEELRLNRRLSPSLYLDVVGIGGSPARPCLRASPDPDPDPDPGAGEAGRQSTGAVAVLEYAVRMVEFPQDALLPAALARGAVRRCHIEALADRLARFHSGAEPADPGGSYGTAAAVLEPVEANITSLRLHGDPGLGPRLDRLQDWITATHRQLRNRFGERLAAGRIRECHGDLHLGNLLLRHDAIEVFDCLEFNASLRWIDPISDLAFLVMDLSQRGHPELALLLLNRWLDASGDWEGLRGWRWYATYRALVRAKVTALRLEQLEATAATAAADAAPPLRRELEAYLATALAFSGAATEPSAPALVITQGVSGSGKSHRARRLCERFGWLQLRSDVERLRLWSRDRYAPERSVHLYRQHLPACADAALAGGWSVLVDATFLRRRQRRRMAALARRRGARFALLHCRVSQAEALRRLERRRRAGGDPSEADAAVLRSQWPNNEEPGPDERDRVLVLTGDDLGEAELMRLLAIRTTPARPARDR